MSTKNASIKRNRIRCKHCGDIIESPILLTLR
ncbi:DUF7695 domain-containing protein [Oceanobacillus bengalensis]